jgi:uncharacterized protein (TIGR02246 family)
MLAAPFQKAPARRAPLVLATAFAMTGYFAFAGQARAQVSAKRPAQASRPAVPSDTRKDDRAAVRAAVEAFVKAFESRDPKALAAHWTAEGEYHSARGTTVHGRDALESAFTALFAKTPELKAEVHPESLRFLARDTAIEEGSVTVRRGATEPATRAHYRTLFVREDGRWRLAELRESPGPAASVEDLAWLAGEWKSAGGQGAEIRTTYSWAPSKKFLNVQFAIREKNLALGGNQVIGVDPANGALHSWTFEANGGVGEADWIRDGDHWILDASGTLPDGSTLTERNILRRVNDDTFTWQSIDRILGDTELPDLAPVKVTRVAAAK